MTELMNYLMSECMNDEGVCRTASATPGMLKIEEKTCCQNYYHMLNNVLLIDVVELKQLLILKNYSK